MSISPEDLAAFADGELDAARAAEVERALAADPELARKVAEHRALRQRLSAHYAPIADEPVPAALAAALNPEDKVVPISVARSRKPAVQRWGWIAGPALAASIALALFVGQQPTGGDMVQGQLADTLDNQLIASQPADADTRILLSFRDSAGIYCRAYTQGEAGAIACHESGGWQVRTALDVGPSGAGDYRQAGSGEAELMAAAQQMAAGAALDADGERDAKARGWQ